MGRVRLLRVTFTVLLGVAADAILTELAILPAGARQQILIADKNYFGRVRGRPRQPRHRSAAHRPQRRDTGAGARFFKPLRQIIEPINQTLKGQLDLERHQGRAPAGVCSRIAQRILAPTAAIWQNDHLATTIRRSPTAYDH